MNCNLPGPLNEGLKLLALLSARMAEAGAAVPVVMGASALTIHCNGAAPSSDIEIAVQDSAMCEAELRRFGFTPDEPRAASKRYWNPDLWVGIRIAARVPFQGRALSARHVLFETGCGPVRVVSAEDTIAQLVAAFDANPRAQGDRLDQATRLYKSATEINRPYLDHRIRDETLGRSLAWFVGAAAQRKAVAR